MNTKADHSREMIADEPHISNVSELSGLAMEHVGDKGFYIDRNIDGHPICHDGDALDKKQILALLKHNEIMADALIKIMRWHGEFPATGKFWQGDTARPMSYATCFGSNGERDFMRKLAKSAVTV